MTRFTLLLALTLASKSGGTYVAEWAKGLDYWRGYAGSMRTRRGVIYGGDTSFVRSGVRVLAWREADKAATS